MNKHQQIRTYDSGAQAHPVLIYLTLSKKAAWNVLKICFRNTIHYTLLGVMFIHLQ